MLTYFSLPVIQIMKLKLQSIAVAIMLFGCGCTQPAPSQPVVAEAPEEYIEAERIAVPDSPRIAPAAAMEGQRYRKGTVRVSGKALEVLDSAGNIVAVNEGIIRLADESGRCPSDGFNRVVVKGDYFTIEQQTCGGMFFVDEYITFKAAPDGTIVLHKFSIVKTNRDDPDEHIPQQDLSTKDFGRLPLHEVQLEKLYGML